MPARRRLRTQATAPAGEPWRYLRVGFYCVANRKRSLALRGSAPREKLQNLLREWYLGSLIWIHFPSWPVAGRAAKVKAASFGMTRVKTKPSKIAIFVAATLALSGSALAQGPAMPKAPVAVNAPGAAADVSSPKAPTGPQPISPATPRVGPAPTGQVVADDYRIGPSDLLEIQVFGVDTLKRDVRVNSRGAISLPLVGTVIVGGLTGDEAETLIAAKYEKDYLQDPQVSIFIKEYTSQRITLEGAVARPGVYPIRGDTSLMQAIAIAGGQGALSDLHEVLVYRREGVERKMYTFDLDKIRAGEAEDPSIVNDDVIVVKRSPGRVAIRDSILGDIINIFNPFNYLPR